MEGQQTIVSYKFEEGYAPKMSNFVFNINDGDGFVTNNNFFGATQKIVSGVPKARTGEEVAAAIVEHFYVSSKKRFEPLTNKWDIKNEGSELIFTSKAKKPYNILLEVPEKENRAEIKGEFLKQQTGIEDYVGVKQVNKVTLNGAIKVNGETVITFEDGEERAEITVTILQDDSFATIAKKVASGLNNLNNWDVTNIDGSAEVIFTSKEARADKSIIFNINNK
ncbi:hypothetical protein [Solibacillus isronensis]|uniref:hypothetical protein n=1 Tax=Solibacillus isronensis TaxID=412383 RepID=UPI0009A6044E|nr:hypothetical protein [Solibacillus isronensis]